LAVFTGGERTPEWPQFAGRKIALTQSCRTAISLLPRALDLNESDEVLVSAYNCGTEVDALLAAGLRVRCVDCDEQGFVTSEILENVASPSTRLLYVIHPFGWPQPLEKVDEWRKRRGILLVEDCALSLFSDSPGGIPIGLRSEVSVFSFPKTLQTPDGGAISWSTDWSGPGDLHRPPVSRTLSQIASRTNNWARRKLPMLGNVVIRKLPAQHDDGHEMEDMPKNYYFEHWRENRACSSTTIRLLGQCQPSRTRQRRRENYIVLSSLLKAQGFDLLFSDLPKGVCPLCCPIRIDQRDAVVSALEKGGIDSSPWWAGGHRNVDWNKFPLASKLKRTILPLPVHHQLNQDDMEYIAEIMCSICD